MEGLSSRVGEFLFEVEPTDPLTYVAMAVTIAGVSSLAAYMPARRASRIDPATVLSCE
jgi:ABC-type lipoprotein release transport system permease subunit